MSRDMEAIDKDYYYRINRFSSMKQTEEYAKELELKTGDKYLPCDYGSHRSPRFEVVRLPKVGEPVSKSFNGDSYPEGVIVSVSKTYRKITTSTGLSFYRVGMTGGWRENGTWWLTPGHINERNPCF